MLKRFKYAKLLIVFCGVIYFCQPIYAQRAETIAEGKEEVSEINGLYRQGKWEEGKKLADEALKKNPRDADLRILVGKYYIHRQSYDKARYELVKSLEYAPTNTEPKQMLVTVETETKRYSSAICYINELLEKNPYGKTLWRKKIELYRDMGNHVEADRLLKRISQIYPEDSELKKDQTYMLEQHSVKIKKSGKIDESIEMDRKLIEELPQSTDNYLSLIDSYIKAGDYNSALVSTERALNQFAGNGIFVQKKIAILEHQQRYTEILAFMDEQMKRGDANMSTQYNYFLLEAARSARNNDPSTLYGKIFSGSAGNKEAFDYLFNDLIAKEQYEEAIATLHRHRKSVGVSKELDMRELMVYKRMGDQQKVSVLTREYFAKYPEDVDLRQSYVTIVLQRAKDNMLDGKMALATDDWKEVIRYGDEESIAVAQQGLYNVYLVGHRYQEAIMVIDDMLLDNPGDIDLMLKKSDLYGKEGRYEYALTIYEQVLEAVSSQDRERYVVGYGELIAPLIKSLREDYSLSKARLLTEQWLAVDGKNQDALLNIINICYQLKDHGAMLQYAQAAEEQYRDDVVFKIKLAEAMNYRPDKLADSWTLLHGQVQHNPFHEPLVNTFVHTTTEYANRLLKGKDHGTALMIIDTALNYKDNDKNLKYMKGLAYEGLKQYDSAYHYQRFYEPSLMEFDEFKSHLDYLGQKSFRNSFAISHIRARFGDDYAISTISFAEYTRLIDNGSSYTGRVNYTGRDTGKGVQGQLEWAKPWTERLSSRIDVGLSNKFFARYALNAAAVYAWKPTWETEAGVGFRRFFSGKNLLNLNLGAVKELENFRLGAKLSNFLLTGGGESFYLYNVMGKVQYFMNNPKNYILAVASVGSSPDIDLLNNQLYNSFNVFNAMVGAGLGRSISRNVGVNVIGNGYNFQTDKTVSTATYRNLYSVHFQFNVSF